MYPCSDLSLIRTIGSPKAKEKNKTKQTLQKFYTPVSFVVGKEELENKLFYIKSNCWRI